MPNLNKQQIGLLVAIIVIGAIGIVYYKKKREGYKRSELGQDNCTLTRAPVDYMSHPRDNPHFKARPSAKYQPLEQGPVDLYFDQRKLTKGGIFAELSNNYRGCADNCVEGGGGPFYTNDDKGRFDLMDIGDYDLAEQMENLDYPANPRDAHSVNEASKLHNILVPHAPYGFLSVTGQ